MPIILAIESSCDDTSAAIIHNGRILSNITATQKIHELYGGVIPEVASRMHQQNIVPVVDAALKKAEMQLSDVQAIAFTRGPGLMGALLVGVSFAKGMALALNIPLIEVNHIEAHVLAHFIDNKPPFPFLCLTVSGGHTQIVKVNHYFDMEILGRSLDDAAGEAFDKTAKILGLPYPGGPLIDKYAQLGQPVFKFTEPNIPDLDFSFSGLKTGILYFIRDNVAKNPDFIAQNLNDICASIQDRIVSILMNKVKKAAEIYGISHIAIAGGVSANSGLRKALEASQATHGFTTYIPKFEYCTDNAAMIAMAAHYKFLENDFSDMSVAPDPRLK